MAQVILLHVAPSRPESACVHTTPLEAMSTVKRFIPLLDRILVQKVKAETKTATGILLPDSAKKTTNWAKVLAAGPGRLTKDGKLVPMSVKAGDTVVVPEYGGMTLKLDDEEYQVFRGEDMVGIIKDE